MKCLRVGATCKKRYNRAYRRYGFVCVSGHLRRVATPPPPPAPASAATASAARDGGALQGDDVTERRLRIRRRVGRHVPLQHRHRAGQRVLRSRHARALRWESPWRRRADRFSGNFKIDVTFNGTITIDQNTDPTTDHVTITGHFSGSSASGTFLEVTQFTDSSTGTAYTCSSNPQTWTATLTG